MRIADGDGASLDYRLCLPTPSLGRHLLDQLFNQIRIHAAGRKIRVTQHEAQERQCRADAGNRELL